jgi:hypothetical protein
MQTQRLLSCSESGARPLVLAVVVWSTVHGVCVCFGSLCMVPQTPANRTAVNPTHGPGQVLAQRGVCVVSRIGNSHTLRRIYLLSSTGLIVLVTTQLMFTMQLNRSLCDCTPFPNLFEDVGCGDRVGVVARPLHRCNDGGPTLVGCAPLFLTCRDRWSCLHNAFARHGKLEGQELFLVSVVALHPSPCMAITSATTLVSQRHITFDLPRDVTNTMLRNLFAR